jgi:hypothetical protein
VERDHGSFAGALGVGDAPLGEGAGVSTWPRPPGLGQPPLGVLDIGGRGQADGLLQQLHGGHRRA